MGQQSADQQCGGVQGRGSVAVLARLAAGVLAQDPPKLWRTDALLVLETRPPILAQEHLLVTDVNCKAEMRERQTEERSEETAEVRRKPRKKRQQREEQSDRMTGGERIVGGGG